MMIAKAICGRSAGALETLSALRDETAGRGLTCRFVEVGCLGPCYAEPLVTVQMPGHASVCFASVDKLGARRIAAYLAGEVSIGMIWNGEAWHSPGLANYLLYSTG